MKTIVILENEIVELESLVGIFKQWQREINILTAREEEAVINIISTMQVDLIVCNLSLPESKKELERLARLSHSFPFVPSIAIASKGANSSTQAMQMGASRCLERPVDTAQLLDQVSELLELSSSGTVKGIPIHSFLQMLENEEKTCTLQIHSKEDTGFIYLKNGAVIGAETQELKDEDAVYAILTWEEAVIEIKYLNDLRKQEIDKPLISLIIEAFRRKDERDKREKKRPGDKPRLQLKRISTVGNRLSLDIGSRIKIEFNGVDSAMVSNLVGMLPDLHLIVTTPTPYSIVNKALETNAVMNVKYVHEGKLCMFKTQLLRSIDAPSHLLFLAYPPVVHYHEMRKAKRTVIFIPCTLHPREGEELYGMIVDLSTSGGLCLIKTKGNTAIPHIEIDDRLQLHCLLPGFREEQEMHGIVKNIKKTSTETRVGVEFFNLQAHLSETIDRYLYSLEHLVN